MEGQPKEGAAKTRRRPITTRIPIPDLNPVFDVDAKAMKALGSPLQGTLPRPGGGFFSYDYLKAALMVNSPVSASKVRLLSVPDVKRAILEVAKGKEKVAVIDILAALGPDHD